MITYRTANKGYLSMTEDEVWRYLETQQTMFVAFVREDGIRTSARWLFLATDRRLYFSGKTSK